jgi:hypothetical protein
MTRYEEIKAKQKGALICVLTLGLAAVPFSLVWRSNIFEGTSFNNQEPLRFFFKLLSFCFLTALVAVPAFVFYLISLIVTTVQLWRMGQNAG